MTLKPSIKEWILVTRPWSFTASGIPAFVAFMFAIDTYPNSIENWRIGILAILGSIIFHAAGNLFSDYFDYKHKVDREDTIGAYHLTRKIFTPKQVFAFGTVLMSIGILIGLYLVSVSGLMILWIGIIGSIGTMFYYQFKFRALGDLLIFLVYGPVIMLGTGYVMLGSIDWKLFLVSLPIAFITVNILHANNTRDIRSDKFAEIKTFAMLIGIKASIAQYYVLTALAYLAIIVLVIFAILPLPALICLLTIPIALKNCKAMGQITADDVSPINQLEISTAQLQCAFSGLLSLGLILSTILC